MSAFKEQFSKIFRVFVTLVLVAALSPITAWADVTVESEEGVIAQEQSLDPPAAADEGVSVEEVDGAAADNASADAVPTYTLQAEDEGGYVTLDDATITGGETISEDGEYQLASDATGTITIADGKDVTIVGKGAEKYSGLSIQVGDGSALTIRDFYADQGTDQSVIDFLGNGTLTIAGTNLIDNDGGLNAAVIHVAAGKEVHFNGTGTLYGYKSALCSYIGGNNGEANGKIVFDGGYWFLKGSKTGAVIGGDSTTVKGDDIVINGGELYVKGVARGALIGGSNQGKAGDVYVNGGLVELFEDFSGPAIGAGNAANAGNLTVTGGSLKTTLSSNSANAYGESSTFGGMPGVSWKAVKALNADDYALLAFDASSYINDMATDTVDVYVDGGDKPFYSGRVYTYVTNEAKNPNLPTGTTTDNWLTNDAQWLVTAEDYGTSAYPFGSETGAGGSSLVPEKNLYFALSKANHTLTVGSDTYDVTWDAEAGAFTCVKQGGEQPDNLLHGGETITEDGVYHLADDATGTITIGDNLDIEIVGSSWDTAAAAFNDTVYKDLNIVVGDNTALTMRDVHADMSSADGAGTISLLDFTGKGSLNIEGHNLFDRSNNYDACAVIHVGPSADVTFGGSGILWGYKHAMGAFIGANGNEVNGKITINSGTWFIKGSKTGPIIGADSAETRGGDITINGGQLYIKGVARGALIGASPQGMAPNVIVNGGLIELFTDFSGSAIGNGGTKDEGGGGASQNGTEATLTVNGGSIKTIVSCNSLGYWGFPDVSPKHSIVSDNNITAVHDTAMLAFDTAPYADDGSVSVYVDGKLFYEGGFYEWCTNEVKNPTQFTPQTLSNWLPNTSEWYYGADQPRTPSEGYPTDPNNGTCLAGDTNLYFQLPKTDHTLTVGEDTYNVIWDEQAGKFRYTGIDWDVNIVLGDNMTATGALQQTTQTAIEDVVVSPAEGYALGLAPTITPDDEGITATLNEDGTYTVSGTPYADVTVTFPKAFDISVHGPIILGPWQVGSPNLGDVTATVYEDGTLLFEGTGDVANYFHPLVAPWYGKGTSVVTSIRYAEGVTPTTFTGFGASGFAVFPNVTSVELPDSITSMNNGAFFGMALTEAPLLPAGISGVMDSTFKDMTSLTKLPKGFAFPEGVSFNYSVPSGLPFYVGSPYSADNPLVTYCDSEDYASLSEAYDWAKSNRLLTFLHDPYTVTVTLGSNMSAAEGAQLTQTVEGVMETVTVTPVAGYVLPEPTVTGGLLVAGSELSGWTISGTPSSDATVVFSDAEEVAADTVMASWNIGSPNEEDVTATLYGDGKLVIACAEGVESSDVQAWSSPWNSEVAPDICGYVRSAEFGEGVNATNLDSYFYGCSNLESVSAIPATVTNLDSMFRGCASLTEAPAIPDSVTSMANTFRGCASLAEAPAIPDSVTSLQRTFQDSGITAAPLLPAGCTYFNRTFLNCDNLVDLPAGFVFPTGTITQVFNTSSAYSADNPLVTYCDAADYEALSAVNWSSYNRELRVREEAPAAYKWYLEPAGEDAYTISTADELAEFATVVNGTVPEAYGIAQDGFAGKTVTLAADADLSAVADWTAIGTADNAFEGTFDGAGKSITGLTIATGTGGYKGLFGNNAGTVKDFSVSGTIGTAEAPITSGADNIGGAVGYNNGTVSGVSGDVSVFVNTGSIYAVGGIVGQNGVDGIVTQCINNADVIASKHSGGVVGRSYGAISECVNTGNVTGNQGGKDGIGGIVGCAGDKNGTYANTVDSCYNTGTITNNGGRWHGGIAGFADKGATVTNCYDIGQITPGYSWNWNPVCGHVDNATAGNYPNWANNYSLEGLNAGDSTAATQPLTIGTVKTADEMKADLFVYRLGDKFNADNAGDDAINDGFPILAWQGGTHVDPPAATPADELALATNVIEALNEVLDAPQTSADGSDVADGEEWVTPEALQALKDAVEAAKDVLDDPAATIADVEAAQAALAQAEQAYADATKTASVDKGALNSAIAAAKAAESGVATSTDGSNVADGKKWTTAAEKKAEDDAIAAAQKVADDAKATQAQVDAATAAVEKATTTYNSAKKLWHRIWGKTAPDTMKNIASRFGKANVAIVTTDANYKDALAASALAGKNNAIVLMTKKGSLTAQTKQALQAAGVKTVCIVGSTNDVTAATQNAIAKVPGVTKVTRVNGASASAKAIAAAKVGGKKSDTVIIATQNGFEDALSIAPYSYATKSPILYAETNKKLSSATTSFIKSAGYKKAIVVGGPIALPASIDSQLKSAGVTSVTRLAGANSYATSQLIAKWSTGQLKNGNIGTYKGKPLAYVKFQPNVKMGADKLAVSTGQNWLDALAGAALCGKNKSVLLLGDAKTAKSNYTLAAGLCKSNKASIKTAAYVFGGTSAVNATVWNALVASTK